MEGDQFGHPWTFTFVYNIFQVGPSLKPNLVQICLKQFCNFLN
jgi:hypothetical protein